MEHRIRDAKGTILIYKGEPICYNILNTFAEQLGEALQRLGEEVEYFDVKQSGEAALAAYAGKMFRLGHMGNIDINDEVAVLGIIERGLIRCGVKVELGKAVGIYMTEMMK